MSNDDDGAGVRVRGLRKRYGDTIALNGLDLDARPGEVLGIAGPNGAGKSTMVKILAGEVGWDEGEILVDGEPWSREIGSRGVAVVHQEPQLFPNLTVEENVVAGLATSGWRWPAPGEEHQQLFDELGVTAVRTRVLGELGLALRQRTEITRALAREARVVLFDEPNSALTPAESIEFFRLLHQLADGGHVVMLISHRLTELAEHSDRVAIILDGRCVRVLEGASRTPELIAEALVEGLDVERLSRGSSTREMAQSSSGGLELMGVSDHGRMFHDVDLSAPAGAVTALVGVEGSGGRELVRACGGLRRIRGEVRVEGRPVRARRLTASVCYVSADRSMSLFTNLSVGENLVIRLDREISRGALGLNRAGMRSRAEDLRTRFEVRAASIDIGVRSLSGGNQQKVAIAAAVGSNPHVLALEEPTRGVDISSKAEIYGILRRFAAEGRSVLLFCTEIPEVWEVADRVHVMSDGRLSQLLEVSSFASMEELAKSVASLETHARNARAVA